MRLRSGLWALLSRIVPALVGTATLLVAVDGGVGALWDRIAEPEAEAPAVTDLASVDLPPAEDERIALDAFADAPWIDRYFAELEHLDFTYVPFVGPREAPVHGRYINTADGIRRSFEPEGADEDAVTVWFFGGSSLWGEGQRDLHTIPSEVARIAEADGVTLRVQNYGLRGYTAMQSLVIFEQELARRDPPDVVVFYQGSNELSTQTEAPANLSEQPTVFQLEVTKDAFERALPLPQAADVGEPTVWADYLDTSAVNQLWRGAGTILAIPSAAADEPFYQPPPALMAQAVDNAASIYQRTMALVDHVAAEHELDPIVFWQPVVPQEPYQELTDRVAEVAGGIDLSHVLDESRDAVFIDGVHTNELGARLVAEAMWPHLATKIEEQRP